MSNNTEFKVGDRVEFTEDYDDIPKGTRGTLTFVGGVEDSPEDRLVCLDLEGHAWRDATSVYDKRLKHVEAHPIEKEFRFFRRSDAAISQEPYDTFEAALAGWKAFAQDGQEVEIIEVVSHGTYKATLKIEEA
jgi:hypothetical protein